MRTRGCWPASSTTSSPTPCTTTATAAPWSSADRPRRAPPDEWKTGAALITVTDTGPGIPPGESERVFDRFYRLDQSRARQTGGSGLGLAICREVMTVLGGSIRIIASSSRRDDVRDRNARADRLAASLLAGAWRAPRHARSYAASGVVMTDLPPSPSCPTCGATLVHVETVVSSGAFRTQAASMPSDPDPTSTTARRATPAGSWASGCCPTPRADPEGLTFGQPPRSRVEENLSPAANFCGASLVLPIKNLWERSPAAGNWSRGRWTC